MSAANAITENRLFENASELVAKGTLSPAMGETSSSPSPSSGGAAPRATMASVVVVVEVSIVVVTTPSSPPATVVDVPRTDGGVTPVGAVVDGPREVVVVVAGDCGSVVVVAAGGSDVVVVVAGPEGEEVVVVVGGAGGGWVVVVVVSCGKLATIATWSMSRYASSSVPKPTNRITVPPIACEVMSRDRVFVRSVPDSLMVQSVAHDSPPSLEI